jgi:acetyltransferase
MDNYKSLRPFLEPRSIAIIGLSRRTGEGSNNALENLLGYGYQGKIYPINPNTSEILGVKAYPSIKDVEAAVDLAVISTHRSRVPAHVRECAERGIKCISIVTQGFIDAGDEEGRKLFKEIGDIAKSSGCRILGPNSFGSANVFHNFSTAFARIDMQKNPVGLICQTGSLFNNSSEFRFTGKAIDVGNICNVDFADCLEYFEHDPDVKAIVLHIEGMQDARRFFNVAKRVAGKKPIVALKTGKDEQAARAASSHTGSLAGRHVVWEAALKQAGAISVDSFEELVDVTRAFCLLPALTNPNVCVATFSGGVAIMALDAMRNTKLHAGKLSQATAAKIERLAPEWLSVGNPVDHWPIVMGSGSMTRTLSDILEILLSDKEFGALLFIQIVPSPAMSREIKGILDSLAAKYPSRPLVATLTGPCSFELVRELQAEGRVLAFTAPERAIHALARVHEYTEFRMRASTD